MEGSANSDAGCDQGSVSVTVTPYYTPYQKQILQKSVLQPVNMQDLSPSSGSDSSAASTKEASGSRSSTSSDSEAESVNDYHGTPVNADGNGPPEAIALKEDFREEKTDNNILWEKENGNYDELLKKFLENEEELRLSNLKLRHSEEENNKLKIQIQKSEGQLENLLEELKLKDDDLEYEKGQVLELQKQTSELETRIPDLCSIIAKLLEDVEVANEQLKISNDEIERLRMELVSRSSETHQFQGQLKAAHENVAKLQFQIESGRKQIRELEDSITWYKVNETNFVLEMENLKAEMLDVQAQFSLEKNRLHSDIVSLSEMKIQLSSRLEEWESRSSLLENKLREYEAEKLKQEELHATQKIVMQDEISSLKEEIGQRRHDVEAVNEEFDRHKQKFDMLMTERDEAKAKIDKLNAEISFRDDQIANMERELFQLHSQQAEMISGSETRLKLVKELKLTVEELEKEVTRQNAVISDLAEEKREAIRQLCISLEHYRSGYQELLRAFTGHRRHAVIAS